MAENQPTPTPANATEAVREAAQDVLDEYERRSVRQTIDTTNLPYYCRKLREAMKSPALSAPASPAQGSLEAACAYYRQGLEMIVKTDYADLASLHYHAQRILDTCDDGNLLLVRFRHQVQRAKKAEAEVAILTAPASPAPVDGERETLQLIDERDEAEEAVSKAYEIVTGRSPEWSNAFGYGHALEEIEECVQSLKDAAKSPAPVANLDGLREPVEREVLLAIANIGVTAFFQDQAYAAAYEEGYEACREDVEGVIPHAIKLALAPQSPAAPGTEAKS